MLGTFSYQKVKEEQEKRIELSLDGKIKYIEQVFSSVEIALSNINVLVYEHLDEPDFMPHICEKVLEKNPIIIGSAIAFVPEYYSERGRYYAPYVFKEDGSFVFKELDDKNYKYYQKEWYTTPLYTGDPYWSEPYYDANGGNIFMTTYAMPLRDESGEVFAIFTADISLGWFEEIVNKIQPFPNSYVFMITKSGKYVLHPDTSRISNETIFSIAEREQNNDIAEFGRKMVAGETGGEVYSNKNKMYYGFYAPEKHTRSSVAIISPYSDLFYNLHLLFWLTIGLTIIGLITLAFFLIRMVKSMLSPLSELTKTTVNISRGNFNSTIPILEREDEIGKLSNSFDFMQKSLVTYMKELKEMTTKRARIDSELEIARRIQMGVLPQIYPAFPDRDDIDLYACVLPAREVSGDLYDFYIHNEKLYLIIGDVSGKGIPAALLMMVTRSLFRNIAAHLNDSAEVVSLINRAISDNNESNMFVTLVVGILDLETGILDYCNAGHNPPLRYVKPQDITRLDVKPNIPAGFIDDFRYVSQKTKLSEDEVIFFYTDGLTEAENSAYELFSEKRLVKVIKKYGNQKTQDIVGSVQDVVKEHVGDTLQSDDVTIMTLRYQPSNSLKPQKYLEQSFENQILEIDKLHSFIDRIQQTFSLSDKITSQLRLAMEEAVSNIINYAFPESGSHFFTLKVEHKTDKSLFFTLKDRGKPFDMTSKSTPDLSLPMEERPIGGLGIVLIKKIMDKIEYKRENNYNILYLTKELE